MLGGLGAGAGRLNNCIRGSSVDNGDCSCAAAQCTDCAVQVPTSGLGRFISVINRLKGMARRGRSIRSIALRCMSIRDRGGTLRARRTHLVRLLSATRGVRSLLTVRDGLSSVQCRVRDCRDRLELLSGRVSCDAMRMRVFRIRHVASTNSGNFFRRVGSQFKSGLCGMNRNFEGLVVKVLNTLPVLVMYTTIVTIVMVMIGGMVGEVGFGGAGGMSRGGLRSGFGWRLSRPGRLLVGSAPGGTRASIELERFPLSFSTLFFFAFSICVDGFLYHVFFRHYLYRLFCVFFLRAGVCGFPRGDVRGQGW